MFSYQRSYTGTLQALIHDWAGTVVDYGCHAPIQAVLETFKRHGVVPTVAESREPMGMFKRDHIQTMLRMPRLAGLWEQEHGQAPDEHAVDTLYTAFGPIQKKIILSYGSLIPGVLETMNTLREQGLKIGSCTGYTQDLMQPLLAHVKTQGYAPDCLVTPDQIGSGRPGPFLVFENMRQLQVYPAAAVVKVGDTVADIEEGLNAGCWVIGLSQTGNEVGLSEEDFQALDGEDQEDLVSKAAEKLRRAGAHYVVNSFADCLARIDEINARLAKGERP